MPDHRALVFELHGVVRGKDASRFTHRNLLDLDRFAFFLSSIGMRIASLHELKHAAGVSFSIDDSTRAAADAAMLIAEKGYPVTLFLNPGPIEERQPYFSSLLNVLLDVADGVQFEYENVIYNLHDFRDRQRFRLHFKQREILSARSGEEQCAMVNALARRLGVRDGLELPPHSQTLSAADVARLANAGVALGNHGWSHVNFSILAPSEATMQIERAAAWLRTTDSVQSRPFAVPFGRQLPPSGFTLGEGDTWILTDERLHAGWVGPSVLNRVALDSLGESLSFAQAVSMAERAFRQNSSSS